MTSSNSGEGSVTAINLRRYVGDGAGGYHWVYGTWVNFIASNLWFTGSDALYLGQTAGGQISSQPSAGWQAVAPNFGGGASTLNELTDVVAGSPNAGEILRYTGGNNWQNAALFVDDLKSTSGDGFYGLDVSGSDVQLVKIATVL